jgi:hypothetical protein
MQKQLWRLIASFVILAGLIWYVLRPNKPAPEKTTAALASFSPHDAQRIEVRQPGKPDVVVTRKSGDEWQIDEPYTAPADDLSISGALSTLASLTSSQNLGPQKNLATFGLNTPAVVTITLKNGQTRVFDFGSDAPTGDATYLDVAGSPDVVTVPTYTKSDALKSAFDFQDKHIVKINNDQVNAIRIQAAGNAVRVAKSGGKWPSDRQDAIQTLLDATQVEQMASVTDPSGKSAAADGLTHPALSVTFETKAGPQTLEVGKKSDSDYYARSSSNGAMIFTISDALVTDIKNVAKPPAPAAKTTPAQSSKPPAKP